MSKYSTIQGDTWDMIAFKQLGSEEYTNLLIQENPTYINQVIFPAGIELSLPEISIPKSSNLPPWKR